MKALLLSCILLLTLAVQLPAAERASGKWWDSAVFYQIFPLSFQDTDEDGRGDIKGILSRLDYLQELGVNALWLTPFHPRSQGFYHGYAVNDYYGVEPELGTLADYEKLIAEAHKKGIKIILDLVLNHSSADHPWFVADGNKTGFKDYYLWKKPAPSGWANATGNSQMPAWHEYTVEGAKRKGEYFYAAFNFTLPDLNHTNPEVVKEFRKVAKYWLDKGVDGFRIDAARYMIETGPGEGQADNQATIQYLNDFARYVKTVKPEAYVIAEVYTGMDNIARYYQPGGLDACYNFDFGGKGGTIQGSMQTGKTRSLLKNLDTLLSLDKKGVPYTYFAHYFSNHDSGRMPENLRTGDKVKTAGVILFTLPGGAPYLYYGDEIGQREGYNLIGDANKRNPMYWDNSLNAGFTTKKGVWLRKMKKYYMDPAQAESSSDKKEAQNLNVAAQKKDPQSPWHLFQKMIALRKSSPALQSGDFVEINIDTEKMKIDSDKEKKNNPLLSYARVKGNEVVVVLINTGKDKVTLNQTLGLTALTDKGWKSAASIDGSDLTKDVPAAIVKNLLAGKLSLSLVSRSYIVVQFKK